MIAQSPAQDLLERTVEDFYTDSQETEEIGDYGASGYDVMVQPTDFSYETLTGYLDEGIIEIPSFQRAYVWNASVASRFIESVYIGLPVPPIYLYHHRRNKYWVVDGQQRLLSMYYFQKNKFPKPGEVVRLHQAILREGLSSICLPDEENSFYSKFSLKLGQDSESGHVNELHGKTYADLRSKLKFTSSRTTIVRNIDPSNHSVAFEIFDRLNTGGMKLSAQQIRMCLYQSKFLSEVQLLNLNEKWRLLAGQPPAKNARDAETILRAIAMLVDRENYESSLNQFLNRFAKKMQHCTDDEVSFLSQLFKAFLDASMRHSNIFKKIGHTDVSRFRVAFFEAVYVASMHICYAKRRMPQGELDFEGVDALANDSTFQELLQKGAAQKDKVSRRHAIALKLVKPL